MDTTLEEINRLSALYPDIGDLSALPLDVRLNILRNFEQKDQDLARKDQDLERKDQDLERKEQDLVKEQQARFEAEKRQQLAEKLYQKEVSMSKKMIEELEHRIVCMESLRKIVGTTYDGAEKAFATKSSIVDFNHLLLGCVTEEIIQKCWHDIQLIELENNGVDEKRDVHPFVSKIVNKILASLNYSVSYRGEKAMYDPPLRPDGILISQYLYNYMWNDLLAVFEMKANDPVLVKQGVGQAVQYLSNIHFHLDVTIPDESRFGVFTNGRKITILSIASGDSKNWKRSPLLDLVPEVIPDDPTPGFAALCRVLAKAGAAVSDEFISIGGILHLVLARFSRKDALMKSVLVKDGDTMFFVKHAPENDKHLHALIRRELENMKHLHEIAELNILDYSHSVKNALVLSPVGVTFSRYVADQLTLEDFPVQKLDLAALSEKSATAVNNVLLVIRETIDQLKVLHLHGWVHGDVRPDNIIVVENKKVYLIDWVTLGRPGYPEYVANGMNFFAADDRFLDSKDIVARQSKTHEFRYDVESLAYSILSTSEEAYRLFYSDFKDPGDYFVQRKNMMRDAFENVKNPVLHGAAKLWDYAQGMGENVTAEQYDDMKTFFQNVVL